MQGTLFPDIILCRTLESIVKLLRADLMEHGNNDTETILYKIIGEDEEHKALKWNFVNFYKQAKKIILDENNMSVNFGYNLEVSTPICMHIILPSEQGRMCIGADEGYVGERDDEGNIQLYHTEMYETTYQIMITGTNSTEVTIVYHIIKSMLLMLVDQIDLMGIRNPSFSGNDIVMQDDLTPVPIFHRVLNISFTYEHNVPKLTKEMVAKNFYYQYRLVDNETESE